MKFHLLSKLPLDMPFWGCRRPLRPKSCFSDPRQLLIFWRSYIDFKSVSLTIWPLTQTQSFPPQGTTTYKRRGRFDGLQGHWQPWVQPWPTFIFHMLQISPLKQVSISYRLGSAKSHFSVAALATSAASNYLIFAKVLLVELEFENKPLLKLDKDQNLLLRPVAISYCLACTEMAHYCSGLEVAWHLKERFAAKRYNILKNCRRKLHLKFKMH